MTGTDPVAALVEDDRNRPSSSISILYYSYIRSENGSKVPSKYFMQFVTFLTINLFTNKFSDLDSSTQETNIEGSSWYEENEEI